MPAESIARAGRDGSRAAAGGQHGRYVIGDEIASGGMATVHLGRMLGDAGFARTVAIKRLHAQYTKDPEICAMLLDEGRLSARIHHLNVVTTLDVVAGGGELFIVMEYVHGEPLSALIRAAIRRGQKIPPRIVSSMLSGALRGLHAAHEARDARGEPLGVVHRDVSPQNILVGSDGMARVLDFGIAKAAGRIQVTQDGRIKGKFGYMPPEQLHGEVLDRRADIYAAGVVLWEALVGARLFAGRGNSPDFARLLEASVDPPSSKVRISPAYDAIVLRALAREAESRWPTALEMAEALETCGPVAPPAEVGTWVTDIAGDLLAELSGRIAAIETRLVSGIRDSLYRLETTDSRVMRLDELGTLRSTPPGAAALLASLPASVPPPAATVDEPPAPVSAPATGRPTLTPEPLPGGTSAMLWTVVAAGGAVAIAATFAVIASIAGSTAPAAHLHGTSTEPPAPTATAAGETLPVPSASAEEASAQPPAPAAPPVPATATATASATQAASPPPSPRAKVTAPTPAPHRPAADGCSPPFTIDAEGHKHYKRECLR